MQSVYNHRLTVLPRTTVRSGIVLSANKNSSRKNWLFELWDEVIEFSTYGPAERKILKARRLAQQEQEEQQEQQKDGGRGSSSSSNSNSALESSSLEDSFRQRVQKIEQKQKQEQKTSVSSTEPSNIIGEKSNNNNNDSSEESQLSVQAFKKAAAAPAVSSKDNEEYNDMIDGYQLRDIIVSRFGVPLDVDFQRGFLPSSSSSSSRQQQKQPLPCVYCTVLPYVGFGSRTRSRHLSELDYLMHLQAVVEILHKYDNIDDFISFIETTTKVPKPGTESLPFRMTLDAEQLATVLGTTQ